MQNLKILFLLPMMLPGVWTTTAVDKYRNGILIPVQSNCKQAYLRRPVCLMNTVTPRCMKLCARRQYKLKLRASGQFRIKPKTNKSVAKRFKITATGKIMYRRAGRSHLQRKKGQGAKRRLRRPVQLKNPRLIRKILSVLHNR